MGNKPGRARSYPDTVDGNSDGSLNRKRRKPTRSQSASQVETNRYNRQSMPDLGGAVPYRPREDSEVDVKVYRSFGDLARTKSESQTRPDIRYYRRSTDGLQKFASLPRHFGRSKSSYKVPNGSLEYDDDRVKKQPEVAYPEMLPPRLRSSTGDSDTGSRRGSQRTSKRVSAASSVSSLAKGVVTVDDFPEVLTARKKLKIFEDQFCRSLVDKYAGLADTLQLSALSIALARGQDGYYRQVPLLDYLASDVWPVDLLTAGDEYVMMVPDALFHGIMHVRRDKISELELWTTLARDVVTCVGVEAAAEVARMYEYQIVLLAGDSATRVVADHAAACVIEYVKAQNAYLDRNSAVLGVVRGTPPAGTQRYMSVILGSRELKWELSQVLRRPGLRKDPLLLSAEPQDFRYYSNADCDWELYGYRGLLLEWDWIHKVYRINAEDEQSFPDDVTDANDDFHRMYAPYRRLFGIDVMKRYLAESAEVSLQQLLRRLGEGSTVEVQPVYRPLTMADEGVDYGCCRLDGVDLTRAQLRGADLSRASVRQAKLLLTDLRGARLSMEAAGDSEERVQGADLSYTSLLESTVDQHTLDNLTTRHVVMRPRKKRVKARSKPSPSEQDSLPNGHSEDHPDLDQPDPLEQSTPVTTRPTKKKRKIPRQLNVESQMNGHHGNGEPSPGGEEDAPDGQEEWVETSPGDNFISDSQGNLLEVEEVIEQKQKKIREKKKRSKKRVAPPIATTPTDPIPETPVFIQEQETAQYPSQYPQAQTAALPHYPHPHDRYLPPQDQTHEFFTESRHYEQPLQQVEAGVELRQQPGRRIVAPSDTEASEKSPTTPKLLDRTDDIVEPVNNHTEEPIKPEKKVKKSKSKTWKSKAEDKETTVIKQESFEAEPKGKGDKKGKVSKKSSDKKKRKSKIAEAPPAIENIPPPKISPNSLSSAPGVGSGSQQEREQLPERPVSAGPGSQRFVEADVILERPMSAGPGSPRFVEADVLVSQKSPGKALSTTNIVRDHNLVAYPHSHHQVNPRDTGFFPRMSKSLSHHGNLGAPSSGKPHNLSFDSAALGLRTARQIYGMSKEEIEFITRSQIFNMIKGLQISNIDTNLQDYDEHITGREADTEAVADLVSSPGRIITLTGAYGNGKSALAKLVGQEIQKKFIVPIWVDLHGCVSTYSVAHRILAVFGLHFRMKEMNWFYNWLNCHEQRLLFILDNVDMFSDDDVAFSDLLDDIVNNVKDSRILCTSRRHFYRGGCTHEVYRLGNLQSSSIQMLKEFIPDLHDEGVEALAEACGHNPFTMKMLCKVFGMEDVDSGKLVEELASFGVHPSLDCVEDRLCGMVDDEGEIELLRDLACCILKILDNIPIAQTELLLKASLFSSNISTKELSALAERKDIDTVKESLEELCDVGLMVKNGDFYRLPYMVKIVNLSKLAESGQEPVDYYKRTIDHLKLLTANYHSKQCEEVVDDFRDHYDNYISVVSRIVDMEDVYEMCPSFAGMEYALFLTEHIPAELYFNFYDCLAQQAREKKDVTKQCRALCCLSYRYIVEGNVDAAREAADEAYNLVQDMPGTEVERAFCLRCLAKVKWEDKDDQMRAMVYMKKALDMFKVAVGSRDIQTIYTNELYAWMLTNRDSHQTARHFYNISDLFLKQIMEDHPLLIEGYNCRRSIWDRLCLFQRAIDMAKKAVEVSKYFLGDHPTTALMYANLCEAIIKRGSLHDAIGAGIAALSIRSKVLGDHLHTGLSYKTLSYLMLRSGQYDEAVRFGQSALEVFDKVPDVTDAVKTETRNSITQARFRLEYKSHVFVEIQSKDASKKDLKNIDLSPAPASPVSPVSVSTDV